MSERGLAARLSESWFGTNLSPHALSQLAEIAELRSYPPDATVLREGAPTTEFGVVLSGRIALRTLVPERGAVTILTVEPGDVFGWSALVEPHQSTSSAVVLEAAEAIVFDGPALRRILASDAALAASVYPRLLTAVARRLVATRTQLLDLYAGQEQAPW
jgi:CRP/FNR family cyclic AMP-dependent transcriptional regulator